jgi:hypothetical protein
VFSVAYIKQTGGFGVKRRGRHAGSGGNTTKGIGAIGAVNVVEHRVKALLFEPL